MPKMTDDEQVAYYVKLIPRLAKQFQDGVPIETIKKQIQAVEEGTAPPLPDEPPPALSCPITLLKDLPLITTTTTLPRLLNPQNYIRSIKKGPQGTKDHPYPDGTTEEQRFKVGLAARPVAPGEERKFDVAKLVTHANLELMEKFPLWCLRGMRRLDWRRCVVQTMVQIHCGKGWREGRPELLGALMGDIDSWTQE